MASILMGRMAHLFLVVIGIGASPCVRPPSDEQCSQASGRTQGDAPMPIPSKGWRALLRLFPYMDGEPFQGQNNEESVNSYQAGSLIISYFTAPARGAF